jgi:hypothetical protein
LDHCLGPLPWTIRTPADLPWTYPGPVPTLDLPYTATLDLPYTATLDLPWTPGSGRPVPSLPGAPAGLENLAEQKGRGGARLLTTILLLPTLYQRKGPCPAAPRPSYLPPADQRAKSTPHGLRGPISIFRKIHLYGKTKKSTHGRTRRARASPACLP